MTDPAAEPPPTPADNGVPGDRPARDRRAQPGDRPPAGQLSRPPSDRYAPRTSPTGPGASGRSVGPARASTAGLLGPAILAGLVTAGLLIVVGGVLAEHRGLLAISGLGGAAIGLLAARGAASPDGTTPAAWTRAEATRIAIGLALATVLMAALGTWVLSRLEGGVMDPLAYLWETTGLLVPAQAAVATVAAALGTAAGPVRWRA